MDIRVSGDGIDLGSAFREHAESRIQAMAKKFFSSSTGASVTLSSGPHDHGFVCEVNLSVAQGLLLKASGRNSDAHQAFERAAERIETQLRRYHSRLKSHYDRAVKARKENQEAAYRVFQALESEEAPTPDNPVIVADLRADVPEATVSDAVMLMDLRSTPALLFRNSATGVYNMIYRREDGNIGWVEPGV